MSFDSSLNFDSAAALDAFETSTPAAEPAQVETPAATPESTAPAAEGTTPGGETAVEVNAQTSASKLAQIADDQLVEIIVDGKPMQMPWKDARGFTMRHADYTRKMQELSRQRQGDALIQVLENRELLQRVIEAKHPELLGKRAADAAAAIQAGQPGFDPEELATLGQVKNFTETVQQAIQQEVQRAREELRKEISLATRTVEENLETAKLTTTINSTVKEIFSADPLIEKLIPNANELLRWNVQQMVTDQSTPAEVLEAFRTVAAGWSEQIRESLTEHNKTAVVNKHLLETTNIQPPGGSPVVPEPASFKDKNGKLDWSKVTEAAMAFGGKK
jgi:hypothetical protein